MSRDLFYPKLFDPDGNLLQGETANAIRRLFDMFYALRINVNETIVNEITNISNGVVDCSGTNVCDYLATLYSHAYFTVDAVGPMWTDEWFDYVNDYLVAPFGDGGYTDFLVDFFVPVDDNHSGVVPEGEGIYAVDGSLDFEAGIAMGPDVVFYEAGPTETAAFTAASSVGAGETNLFLLHSTGAPATIKQVLVDGSGFLFVV